MSEYLYDINVMMDIEFGLYDNILREVSDTLYGTTDYGNCGDCSLDFTTIGFIPYKKFADILWNVDGLTSLYPIKDEYAGIKTYTYKNDDVFGIFFGFEVEGISKKIMRGIEFPYFLTKTEIREENVMKEIQYKARTFASIIASIIKFPLGYILNNTYLCAIEHKAYRINASHRPITSIRCFVKLPIQYYMHNIRMDANLYTEMYIKRFENRQKLDDYTNDSIVNYCKSTIEEKVKSLHSNICPEFDSEFTWYLEEAGHIYDYLDFKTPDEKMTYYHSRDYAIDKATYDDTLVCSFNIPNDCVDNLSTWLDVNISEGLVNALYSTSDFNNAVHKTKQQFSYYKIKLRLKNYMSMDMLEKHSDW